MGQMKFTCRLECVPPPRPPPLNSFSSAKKPERLGLIISCNLPNTPPRTTKGSWFLFISILMVQLQKYKWFLSFLDWSGEDSETSNVRVWVWSRLIVVSQILIGYKVNMNRVMSVIYMFFLVWKKPGFHINLGSEKYKKWAVKEAIQNIPPKLSNMTLRHVFVFCCLAVACSSAQETMPIEL